MDLYGHSVSRFLTIIGKTMVLRIERLIVYLVIHSDSEHTSMIMFEKH